MALREAESRRPDVAYRADDPAGYAQALAPVLDVLAEHSPIVEWSAEPVEASAAVRHEPTARYAIFLDGTGLDALYGSEERLGRLIVEDLQARTGHQAHVGIADGRYAAFLGAVSGSRFQAPGEATRTLKRETWNLELVRPGGDAAFLAPLPVDLLPLPAEARERVARIGARTLRDFTRLPANSVRHRFGPDGVLALALAAGHDEGPLRPRPTPLLLHDSLTLEWVVTSLDQLLFLLKRLADRLSVRLRLHGLDCGRLRVTWLLDDAGLATGDDLGDAPPPGAGNGAAADGTIADGALVSTIRLAEPAGSGSSLLEHLRWYVEGLRPEVFRDPASGQTRGVRGIVVEAEELGPLGGRQLALLPGEDGRAPDAERQLTAERALARLRARWGEAAVQQAELVASRRPEQAVRWRNAGPASRAPAADRRKPGRATLTPPGGRRGEVPLWLLGQPHEVEVERGGRLPNGRRRAGTIKQGQRVRRIARAAGPWRLVERWAPEPVARDAYHVVLTDGTACWLVHDRLDDRWRLFGTFD